MKEVVEIESGNRYHGDVNRWLTGGWVLLNTYTEAYIGDAGRSETLKYVLGWPHELPSLKPAPVI